MNLTKREHDTLVFIQDWLNHNALAPSLAEICEYMPLSSIGTAHRYVTSLEHKGHICRAKGRQRSIRLTAVTADSPVTSVLPVLGKIAAGQPIEAIADMATLDVSELLGGSDRYVLKVDGSSMQGIGILNGDWVVIEKADTARDGEVVVALVDQENATLKRLFRRGTDIELHAENPQVAPIKVTADRVSVQGILVGLIRIMA